MSQRKQLTDKAIRAAKPGAELSDPLVPGLRFRVSERGRRTFIYRYRHPENNALRKVTLGEYGTGEYQITLEKARAEVLRLRGVRKAGCHIDHAQHLYDTGNTV